MLCVHYFVELQGLVSHDQRVVVLVTVKALVDRRLQVAVVLLGGIQNRHSVREDVPDDAFDDDMILGSKFRVIEVSDGLENDILLELLLFVSRIWVQAYLFVHRFDLALFVFDPVPELLVELPCLGRPLTLWSFRGIRLIIREICYIEQARRLVQLKDGRSSCLLSGSAPLLPGFRPCTPRIFCWLEDGGHLLADLRLSCGHDVFDDLVRLEGYRH
jgi:hypothetical protein